MKRMIIGLIAALCICACSSSGEEEQPKEIKSEITSDYLCSVMFWVKENASKPNRTTYYFARAYDDYLGLKYDDFTGIDEKKGKSFTYKINAPYIDITFKDGSKERIEVYAIKKENQSGKYIYINGSSYLGFFDGSNVK